MHEYGVDAARRGTSCRARTPIVAGGRAREFSARPIDDFVGKLEPGGVFVDVKCQADADALRARGVSVWRL